MSRALSIIKPAAVIEAAIMPEAAVLNATDMAYMNFARAEYRALEKIIVGALIPALGAEHPAAVEMRRHIEQICIFSGNFCYQHRHLGQMHDALNVGGAV